MSRTVTFDMALTTFAESVGRDGPIAVVGGRTRWSTGGVSAAGTRFVEAPTGIVSFEPEEMIVTVRAGTSVSDLDAALGDRRQRAALPDRGGTVGGAIAVGENTLESLGRGSLRSSVLQVRYVSAEGKIITGGGPTVKNVTGFDLPRLMVGSLGTLGLIAEVILRTNPIPAVCRWFMSEDVAPAEVRSSVLRPGAVLFDGKRTWVLLEGHGADVESTLERLRTLARFTEVQGPPALPPYRWLLRPSDMTKLADLDIGNYVASIGVGVVFAERPQPARPIPPAIRALNKRVKDSFDPFGRLNPGRVPGASS
jgi:FAD/FMN-containing dehydrogenase